MVVFDRCGPSGNIFFIMASASRELRNCGRSGESDEMIRRVQECESYDAALSVIREYVDLLEV